jgi:hypothetical protein
MLKKLFKYVINKSRHKERVLVKEDIVAVEKVFFAVFSRYGDGIISFKVIRELIELYPTKKYLLFTTNQLVPYAQELLGERVEVVGVNKRNPISLALSVMKLKKFDADLGFNPWSHGDDAEFFISFAKRFYSYKKFSHHPKEYNVYDRVREYFCLPTLVQKSLVNDFAISGLKKIVVAPLSTDVKKNISVEDLEKLVDWLKKENPEAKIHIAVPKLLRLKNSKGVSFFIFGKSAKKSNAFLSILKECDLFVGVDSGPLHLALCMGKKCIGVFGSNAAETIVSDGFQMISLRHLALLGIFCFVRNCEDAECIHAIFKNNPLDYKSEISEKIRLEELRCPLPQ